MKFVKQKLLKKRANESAQFDPKKSEQEAVGEIEKVIEAVDGVAVNEAGDATVDATVDNEDYLVMNQDEATGNAAKIVGDKNSEMNDFEVVDTTTEDFEDGNEPITTVMATEDVSKESEPQPDTIIHAVVQLVETEPVEAESEAPKVVAESALVLSID